MKKFDLNSMDVQEINDLEMQEIDGGLLLLLTCIATGLLVASCINNTTVIQIGGSYNVSNPSGGGTTSADGNNLDLAKRFNMPIGY
jgi:hypothetical protein